VAAPQTSIESKKLGPVRLFDILARDTRRGPLRRFVDIVGWELPAADREDVVSQTIEALVRLQVERRIAPWRFQRVPAYEDELGYLDEDYVEADRRLLAYARKVARNAMSDPVLRRGGMTCVREAEKIQFLPIREAVIPTGLTDRGCRAGALDDEGGNGDGSRGGQETSYRRAAAKAGWVRASEREDLLIAAIDARRGRRPVTTVEGGRQFWESVRGAARAWLRRRFGVCFDAELIRQLEDFRRAGVVVRRGPGFRALDERAKFTMRVVRTMWPWACPFVRPFTVGEIAWLALAAGMRPGLVLTTQTTPHDAYLAEYEAVKRAVARWGALDVAVSDGPGLPLRRERLRRAAG
jgi:hypothetical protein